MSTGAAILSPTGAALLSPTGVRTLGGRILGPPITGLYFILAIQDAHMYYQFGDTDERNEERVRLYWNPDTDLLAERQRAWSEIPNRPHLRFFILHVPIVFWNDLGGLHFWDMGHWPLRPMFSPIANPWPNNVTHPWSISGTWILPAEYGFAEVLQGEWWDFHDWYWPATQPQSPLELDWHQAVARMEYVPSLQRYANVATEGGIWSEWTRGDFFLTSARWARSIADRLQALIEEYTP